MKTQNRKEIFLKALANGEEANIKPLTREEMLLKKQAERESAGGGGGASHWDDIEGKPFEMVGSDTLTWDGNTEGLLSVGADSNPMYKISDATPSLYELQTATVILNDDTAEVSSVSAIEGSPNEAIMVIIQFGFNSKTTATVLFVILKDNIEYEGMIIPKKGIYASRYSTQGEDVFVSSITINGYTGFTQEKIKEEYLPSGGGAFVVNITEVTNEEEGFYDVVLDKTYDEIITAVNNNQDVVVIHAEPVATARFTLYEIGFGGELIFMNFVSASESPTVKVKKLFINSDGARFELMELAMSN